MANKKINAIEAVKKKYVRTALESNKITSTAKSAGVHRDTLRKWIKEYEIEVRDEMEVEGVNPLPPEPSRQELEKRYEEAMMLLGEKELEVAVLRKALKKNDIY